MPLPRFSVPSLASALSARAILAAADISWSHVNDVCSECGVVTTEQPCATHEDAPTWQLLSVTYRLPSGALAPATVYVDTHWPRLAPDHHETGIPVELMCELLSDVQRSWHSGVGVRYEGNHLEAA